MGPKTFVKCHVCSKEFGSKSISFHEPKCLDKWRSANKTLPSEKRFPTPVKPVDPEQGADSSWICSHCQVSVPKAKRSEHVSVCLQKVKSGNLSKGQRQKKLMTNDNKVYYSPKKGKENTNLSNRIPVQSVKKKIFKKDAKSLDCVNDESANSSTNKSPSKSIKTEERMSCSKSNIDDKRTINDGDDDSSTSKRSVRPQTKILRRPTPNLQHPVIQIDSDDSGDGTDKSKDDNPKRLKTSNEVHSIEHKRKNFIIYNKYNVEKNTKNVTKDKVSSSLPNTMIPNPCNSCNRNFAPERLHSHVKRDARGLMYRRSPSLDIKISSPSKKVAELESKKPKEEKVPEENETIQNGEAESSVGNEAKIDEIELSDPIKPCYICETELKISMLLLHESKCLETWKKDNNSLPPNLRKLPPRKPVSEEKLAASDPAWLVVQSQLVPCLLCGRTFFPERLPVHERVCKGKASPQPLKRASSLREQSASRRDGEDEKSSAVYVSCNICGRSYGSWVIPMHEAQCFRKWHREKERLSEISPCEESDKPAKIGEDDDVTSLIELGDHAWESHLQHLVPCPRCSRTFFPDRLEVHERSCKGPSCSRRPRSNKGT